MGKAAASARASVGGQVQRGSAKVEEDAQTQRTAPSLGTQSARTAHRDQRTRKPHRGLPIGKELICNSRTLMTLMIVIASLLTKASFAIKYRCCSLSPIRCGLWCQRTCEY